MRYQLVALDLDDTLFGGDLIISPANLEAIARLKGAGVRLCVNTGRFYSTAAPFAQKAGLEGLMGLCQGAAVVDMPSHEVLFTSPVPRAIAVELLQYAEENDLLSQYYTVDDFFHDRKNEMTALYEALAGRSGVLKPRPLYAQLEFDPLKVLYVAQPDVIQSTYTLMRERYGEALEITVSRPNYLEFNKPGTTKGNALRIMAEYYNIPMEATAAIGDARNDCSMLRDAALGIAMGDAPEDVRACADVVTLPCAQDGFAHAMEDYILKG